jgi:hypothetical protein
MLQRGVNPFATKAVPADLLVSPITEDGYNFLNIESDRYLPLKTLSGLCDGHIMHENVSLYQLRFPDPLNPKVNEITIAIPPLPAEGWVK